MRDYEILLVDDDDLILNTIGPALEIDGYCVTTAESGETAISLINDRYFDLIITDLVMDSVDGIGVLKHAGRVNPDTMTIVLTGFGDITSAIEALRSDADDYLLKPCEPEEISFRVSRCLEKLELKRKITLYEGILPVCCVCKKIRDDSGKAPGTGEWMSVENFMFTKAGVSPSSSYCPACAQEAIDELDQI